MKNKPKNFRFGMIPLMIVEAILLLFLFSLFTDSVTGGVGTPNATVITRLTVGNVRPEVLNVTINNAAQVVLNANSTRVVSCVGLIRDWNNETDFGNATGILFNISRSGGSDDRNSQYTNDSCIINRTFLTWRGVQDTNYTALANCTFNVWYNAEPGIWNCTIYVNDTAGLASNLTGSGSVAELLAVELPNIINYGVVSATYVSDENITNVTNVGNIRINLSLSGYAQYVGDGNSMNCSLGASPNISIENEKYNLTGTNSADSSLSEVETHYINLTANAVVKEYNLDYRQDETVNEATNLTYWRMYVPVGVGGTCTGNIVFGATKAAGTPG